MKQPVMAVVTGAGLALTGSASVASAAGFAACIDTEQVVCVAGDDNGGWCADGLGHSEGAGGNITFQGTGHCDLFELC